jgi:hypothetical protein
MKMVGKEEELCSNIGYSFEIFGVRKDEDFLSD